MPKVTIAPKIAPGAYSGASTFAWTKLSGATGANGNQTPLTGAEVLLFRNRTTGSRPLLIESVDDPFGRAEDISVTIASGSQRVFGPVKITGWKQSDGFLYFESTATQIECAVLKIPGL